MKKMTSIKKSILTAACIALCLVLPMALHAIPNAGKIFCPMHIPVLLCGMICGWQYGLLCGLAGPFFSCILTQMPVMANLPSMMVELAVYGLFSGWLMQLVHTKKLYADLYISLMIAMLAGRIAAGASKALIFAAGEYSVTAWITGHFLIAWPALLIHLALIPLLYTSFEKAKLIPKRYPKKS